MEHSAEHHTQKQTIADVNIYHPFDVIVEVRCVNVDDDHENDSQRQTEHFRNAKSHRELLASEGIHAGKAQQKSERSECLC